MAVPRRAWPALAAVLLLAVETLAAAAGLHSAALSAAALALGPGLALQPFLPRELGPFGRWLAVPAMGCAAAPVLLISLSRLGVALTGSSVRLMLILPALLAVVVSARAVQPSHGAAGPSQVPVALGLGAVLCLAAALQGHVIAGSPVPGTDWGHYLLYPDQIARHGSLELDNPFWMTGGQPFRDDPGLGALYGAVLLMSKADPAVLAHGIWVFALLGVVSVFLLASALAGPNAGLGAAGVYAVIPMNQTMLGWHGLANEYGLMLLALVLVAAVWALRSRAGPGRRWAFWLALLLVALAAGHRLTMLVCVGALGLIGLYGLAPRRRRRGIVVFVARTAAFAVPLGLLVAVDLVRRGSGSGGVQSYRTYLVTKVDLGLALSDLTIPVTVLGVLGLALLVTRLRLDRGLFVLYALGASVLVLSYGWVVHLPTVYYRMVYFLPLVLAPAVGVCLAWVSRSPLRVGRWRMGSPATAMGIALLLVMVTAVVAADRGPSVRAFYEWASPASLRGLQEVDARTGPRDAVVADRCWGFLSPWLLQRPVLAGIDPADILPSWEASFARSARKILYGRPADARRTARRFRVRYALVNPGCSSDETSGPRLPSIGVPIYESRRLVVLDLRPRGGGG